MGSEWAWPAWMVRVRPDDTGHLLQGADVRGCPEGVRGCRRGSRTEIDSFVACSEDVEEGTSIFDEYVPDQLGAVQRPVQTVASDGLFGLITRRDADPQRRRVARGRRGPLEGQRPRNEGSCRPLRDGSGPEPAARRERDRARRPGDATVAPRDWTLRDRVRRGRGSEPRARARNPRASYVDVRDDTPIFDPLTKEQVGGRGRLRRACWRRGDGAGRRRLRGRRRLEPGRAVGREPRVGPGGGGRARARPPTRRAGIAPSDVQIAVDDTTRTSSSSTSTPSGSATRRWTRST